MDYEKEISFGAFDSELMHQEIFIPEGFEATIEGNKIILKKIESEDKTVINNIKKVITWYKSLLTEKSLTTEQYDEIFAWLEKQGEHANFRNKIQIGDKVTRNRDGVLVNLSQLDRVAKKDEQILANSVKTCKDKQKPDDKIEQKSQRMVSAEAKEALYDKPAWSEEDRTMAFTLMRDVDQMSYISKEGKNERIGWLNSLDEKFASTESIWGEEDEKMLNDIDITFFEEKSIPNVKYWKFMNWLKSLKQRIGG